MCQACTNNKGTPLTINALLKGDPTRTLTLRRRFEADLVRRFKRIRRDIITSVDTNDCFGLKENNHKLFIQAAIPQKAFAFERDSQKINSFMAWLQEQINNEILEIFQGQQIGDAVESAWTNKYIQSAYQKGIVRGRQELRNAGYNVPIIDQPMQGGLQGGIQAAFNQPFHLDRVGLIYTRTYRGLKGVTDEMDKQISQTLAQGLADGDNPNVIARKLSNRVDKIGITRARTLARTEVIRAHHVATIQEYKNWGIEEVKVLAEWSTAGDSRVCPLCRPLEGKIYTLDKIEGMIPRHPNCRCIALPLDVTDNPNFEEMVTELEAV